jgi:hypothetical protein
MKASEAAVREVETERDFDSFFRLPWKIYRGDPLWVPPIKSTARSELRRESNPFLLHCEHRLFLLERDGVAVGRIAAMVDTLAVETWGEAIGMFAYFECGKQDREGAKLLLDAALGWLHAKGMKTMRGPWSFLSQEWGLVVEGFAPQAVVMAPYNPPEYAAMLESFGLRKAKDLLAWEMSVPDGYRIPDRIMKLTDAVARRYGLIMRAIDFSKFDEEVALFAKLSLDTLKDNWGISPITDE